MGAPRDEAVASPTVGGRKHDLGAVTAVASQALGGDRSRLVARVCVPRLARVRLLRSALCTCAGRTSGTRSRPLLLRFEWVDAVLPGGGDRRAHPNHLRAVLGAHGLSPRRVRFGASQLLFLARPAPAGQPDAELRRSAVSVGSCAVRFRTSDLLRELGVPRPDRMVLVLLLQLLLPARVSHFSVARARPESAALG